VAEPPTPALTPGFFRLLLPRPKPVQRRLPEYLSGVDEATVSAISATTGIGWSSVQRSLRLVKGRGFARDRWIDYAAGFLQSLWVTAFYCSFRMDTR